MRTPGPWVYGTWGGQCHKNHTHNRRGGEDGCVYDPVFYEGGGITGPNRETVVGSDYDGLVMAQEDAQLIATAPDLLKIAQIFLGHDARFQVAVVGNPIAVDDMLAKARDIVAKATGG